MIRDQQQFVYAETEVEKETLCPVSPDTSPLL